MAREGAEKALEPTAYRRRGGGWGQESRYGKPTTEKAPWARRALVNEEENTGANTGLSRPYLHITQLTGWTTVHGTGSYDQGNACLASVGMARPSNVNRRKVVHSLKCLCGCASWSLLIFVFGCGVHQKRRQGVHFGRLVIRWLGVTRMTGLALAVSGFRAS